MTTISGAVNPAPSYLVPRNQPCVAPCMVDHRSCSHWNESICPTGGGRRVLPPRHIDLARTARRPEDCHRFCYGAQARGDPTAGGNRGFVTFVTFVMGG